MRYGRTQERLARERKGRMTASRIGESERNWSPTADLLSELMRLGVIERKPLPSARKFIDVYRDEKYELTERGTVLAEAAAGGRAAYVDRISEALIEGHPHLQRLLTSAASGSVVCPVLGEGAVQRGPPPRPGRGLCNLGPEMIGPGIEPISPGDHRAHLRRRGRTACATGDGKSRTTFSSPVSRRGMALDATTTRRSCAGSTSFRWRTNRAIAGFDRRTSYVGGRSRSGT